MENLNRTQLEFNFTQRSKRTRTQTAVDRILANFKRQNRLEYFREVKAFRQDRFIGFGGLQVF